MPLPGGELRQTYLGRLGLRLVEVAGQLEPVDLGLHDLVAPVADGRDACKGGGRPPSTRVEEVDRESRRRRRREKYLTPMISPVSTS